MTDKTLCFGSITPAHWERMTADRSFAFSRNMRKAKRWLKENRGRREVLAAIRQTEEIQRQALFRVQAWG